MYINFHTHHTTRCYDSISVVNLTLNELRASKKLPKYCSVGVHPWHAQQDIPTESLNNFVNIKNIIALGECGLDKHRGPDLTIQLNIFKKQVILSENIQLPLIIHCVKAYSEIIKLRKDIQPKQPWIFHGFNASQKTMEQALHHGFLFSFGNALFNSNSKATQVLPFIPYNKLFLETDDKPQLRIESIYKKASTLLNIKLDELQFIISNNFNRLFNVHT